MEPVVTQTVEVGLLGTLGIIAGAMVPDFWLTLRDRNMLDTAGPEQKRNVMIGGLVGIAVGMLAVHAPLINQVLQSISH